MLQFYFLSILLNALAGYILVSVNYEDALEFKSGFSLKDETFTFVIGILSAVIGLLKILSAVEGDVPVIGDLLPAAAGMLAGFLLISGYYRGRSGADDADSGFLAGNKKLIGIAALAAAALHFLFPKVMLL